MTDDEIALTQAELDKVLNSVRKDNAEHDEEDEEAGVALSQAELDRLFSGGSSPFAEAPLSKPSVPPVQETSIPEPEVSPVADLPPEELSPKTEEKSNQDLIDAVVNAREAKIAERKARMAEMLAQANASSPRRIQVIYGSALKSGAELDAIPEGGVLELDRMTTELAEIYVDGKLYARGKLGSSKDGHTAIKITQKLS